MVSQFYNEIEKLPQVSDQEMGTFMQQLSVRQNNEFDTIAALKELYIYVTNYKEQVCVFNLDYCMKIQLNRLFAFTDNRST